VPNSSNPHLHIRHMSANSETTKFYLCQMPGLLSYTWAICQQVQKRLSESCVKCWHSSIKQVLYVWRYKDPSFLFVLNASIPPLYICHTSADREKFCYAWAKSQVSRVIYVPYVGRYTDFLVSLVPNSNNSQKEICHISTFTGKP